MGKEKGGGGRTVVFPPERGEGGGYRLYGLRWVLMFSIRWLWHVT